MTRREELLAQIAGIVGGILAGVAFLTLFAAVLAPVAEVARALGG